MLALLYLALVLGVNLGFSHLGPHPVVFVLVGLVMAARDFVHERYGALSSFALIIAGAGIAASLADPMVAAASVAGFLLAETLDLAVYAKVRKRIGIAAGVAVSGLVGSVVDSAVFLLIAFGSLDFFGAQVTGKVAATLGAAALVLAASRYRREA